jgi:hypothetical protein
MGVATRQIRVVNNQLHWFPQKIAMPIATNLDMIRATLEDLKIAIAAPQSDTPIRNLPDNLRNELSDELTQSFEQHLSQNPQPSIEALLKMLGHPMEEPAPLLGVAPDLPGHSQPPEDQHMPPPGFAATVAHPDTGAPAAEYKHLIKSSQKERCWEIAMCKEQGRLFQPWLQVPQRGA